MSAVLSLPVELYPMNQHDLDAVAELDNSVQAYPWSRRNFADSLAAGHSAWVCRIGGNLVGFSILMVVVDEAHLLNIAVAKRYQGRGHGARLVRHVMEQAKLYGATRLLLEVRQSNQRAQELYQLFGFRQIGQRRGYYPAAAGREDALVMERELP